MGTLLTGIILVPPSWMGSLVEFINNVSYSRPYSVPIAPNSTPFFSKGHPTYCFLLISSHLGTVFFRGAALSISVAFALSVEISFFDILDSIADNATTWLN